MNIMILFCMFMLMLNSEILKEEGIRGVLLILTFLRVIIVDHNGKPVEIREYERNKATKTIEEFMLIAMKQLQRITWQEIPFLYRTHDKPDDEKINTAIFINNFGIQ